MYNIVSATTKSQQCQLQNITTMGSSSNSNVNCPTPFSSAWQKIGAVKLTGECLLQIDCVVQRRGETKALSLLKSMRKKMIASECFS